jgi:hypothetical protein
VYREYDGAAGNSLAVYPGLEIEVQRGRASEGWCWGQVPGTGAQGWVPRSHLDLPLDEAGTESDEEVPHV